MPSLNNIAQLLMGASGGGLGPLSIDGAVPPQLAGERVSLARFRAPELVVYQRCVGSAGCVIEQFNTNTKAFSMLANRGANWIQAGGGAWAVRTQGLGAVSYLDSFANIHSQWRPLAVDPITGHIYIQFDYNTGYGLGKVTGPGNTANTLLSATCSEAAAWGGNWAAKILPGRLAFSINNMGPVTVNTPMISNIAMAGEYVVGNGAHGLLLIDPVGDRYVILSKTGTDFWPAITKLSNQHYVIATAKTAGEAPGDGTVYNVNPTTLEWLPMSTPEPVPEPVPTGVCLKPHPRPLWIAPYQAVTDRWGDDTNPVGNCALITVESPTEVESVTIARAKRAVLQGYKALIIDPRAFDPSFVSLVIGLYLSASTVAEMRGKVEATEASIQNRILPDVPLILYIDTGDITSIEPWMNPERHWISPQLYRETGEPLGDFMEHMSDTFEHWEAANFKLIPTWHAFDRNGLMDVEEVMETQTALAPMVQRTSTACIGFLPFSDMRQGENMGGMNFYPQLKKELRRYDVAQPEDRPNRYSYWVPRLTSPEDVLRNQLGQDRELVLLSRKQKDFILEKL